MMENPYTKYLTDRLKRGMAFCSGAELSAITAIDFYEASGSFVLLLIYASECYAYKCKVRDDVSPKRFVIEQMQTIAHGLQQVYNDRNMSDTMAAQYDQAYFMQDGAYVYDQSYDTMFPQLAAYNQSFAGALKLLPQQDCPIYISGKFCDKHAVIYALQQKAERVVAMSKHDSLNMNRRFNFSQKIASTPLCTSTPGTTILSCLRPGTFAVYVPLQAESLDSLFWDKTTWKDILPNTDEDCRIAYVPCKYITIDIEIDGFNNVFCRTTDAQGRQAYKLINNALGVDYKADAANTPDNQKEKAGERPSTKPTTPEAESGQTTDKQPQPTPKQPQPANDP